MYSKEYTYDTYKNTVITKYQILITNPPAPPWGRGVNQALNCV